MICLSLFLKGFTNISYGNSISYVSNNLNMKYFPFIIKKPLLLNLL